MAKNLQINVTANWGSTGKIAEQIGQTAMRHGWDSYIAYGRMINPSKSQLIRVGSQLDVYSHYAVSRALDAEGLLSKRATIQLVKTMEEIKPDVVHLHNIHDHYLNYPALFRYLAARDIPVVWTFHDCWAFTGHCAHFVTAGCEKWKTGCYDCPLKGDYPKSLIDCSRRNYELKKRLFVANKNLHIVPVSDWMAGFVKESFLKDKEVTVIKNGVDLDIFKPSVYESKGKNRILGVSGVWKKDKGLYDFYRLRELLDDKYEIILVGLSKEQMKELPTGIIGIEHTESVQELAQLYSSASVFVNPTYADTFPTVNLEALACGTPVITYRTGGSPEAVTPETGWVVEQEDVEGIASIVKSLESKDKSEMSAQRMACRKRAEQEFDKNKCFEKYVELYEGVVSQRQR